MKSFIFYFLLIASVILMNMHTNGWLVIFTNMFYTGWELKQLMSCMKMTITCTQRIGQLFSWTFFITYPVNRTFSCSDNIFQTLLKPVKPHQCQCPLSPSVRGCLRPLWPPGKAPDCAPWRPAPAGRDDRSAGCSGESRGATEAAAAAAARRRWGAVLSGPATQQVSTRVSTETGQSVNTYMLVSIHRKCHISVNVDVSECQHRWWCQHTASVNISVKIGVRMSSHIMVSTHVSVNTRVNIGVTQQVSTPLST